MSFKYSTIWWHFAEFASILRMLYTTVYVRFVLQLFWHIYCSLQWLIHGNKTHRLICLCWHAERRLAIAHCAQYTQRVESSRVSWAHTLKTTSGCQFVKRNENNNNHTTEFVNLYSFEINQSDHRFCLSCMVFSST